MADAKYCILDMKQVSEIDITGAKILGRLYNSLNKQGKLLMASNIDSNHPLWNFLQVSGVHESFAADYFFANMDLALERAEDHLLAEICHVGSYRQIRFEDLNLLRGFSENEIEIMRDLLEIACFQKGEWVII